MTPALLSSHHPIAPLSPYHPTNTPSRLSRAFAQPGGAPRLLPFVDMLNHHPEAGEITLTARTNLADDGTFFWQKKMHSSSSSSNNGNTNNGNNGYNNGNANGYSNGNSGMPNVGLEKDKELRWAYKRGATPFDLLYLYGIVTDFGGGGGGGSSSFDLQWSGKEAATVQLAIKLFKLINPNMISTMDQQNRQQNDAAEHITHHRPSLQTPYRISLLFSELSINDDTMGYARVVALAQMMDSNSPGAAEAVYAATASDVNLHRIRMTTPAGASPLGQQLEIAALQILQSIAQQLPDGNALGHNADGSQVTKDAANHGAPRSRLIVAQAFREQRSRVRGASMRMAEEALAKLANEIAIAAEPPIIDYLAF